MPVRGGPASPYHCHMESMDTLVVAPIERDIVLVEGSDARSYLQTQMTQDVMSLGLGNNRWSFILNPSSSIEALVRVTRIGHDRLILDSEPGYGGAIRSRLDGLLFRTDARFTEMTWPGLSWRGPGAHSVTVDAPVVARVPLAGIEASDVVGPGVEVPEGVETIGSDDLDRFRIAGAWPSMAHELTEGITPSMTGLVDMTVSFDKGCYTGQELVARTHHRGAAPTKRLVSLRFLDAVNVGATVIVDGEEAGVVTSASRDIGLGYLGRRFETPGEGEAAGVAVRMFEAGDRFSAAL